MGLPGLFASDYVNTFPTVSMGFGPLNAISRTGVRRVVAGGVGQTLIRHAGGPVAVVRPTS